MDFIQNIDNKILFAIQNLHYPILDQIMIFITKLGNIGFIWFLIAIILLTTKKYRRYGFILCISICVSVFLGSFLLKPLIARVRPCDTFTDVPLLIQNPEEYSFPSGHATSSFAAATILFFANKKWAVWAFLLAALISFSRVYLFVHYPSDIIGGAILGIGISLLIVYGFKLIMPPPKHIHQKRFR